MTTRVGINGFGRIGRQVLRAAKEQGVADLDFIAVNDLTDTKTLAHLFKYDSVHRTYRGEVKATGQGFSIDGDEIRVFAEKRLDVRGFGSSKPLGGSRILDDRGELVIMERK